VRLAAQSLTSLGFAADQPSAALAYLSRFAARGRICCFSPNICSSLPTHRFRVVSFAPSCGVCAERLPAQHVYLYFAVHNFMRVRRGRLDAMGGPVMEILLLFLILLCLLPKAIWRGFGSIITYGIILYLIMRVYEDWARIDQALTAPQGAHEMSVEGLLIFVGVVVVGILVGILVYRLRHPISKLIKSRL
jgi:hypothetical protein